MPLWFLSCFLQEGSVHHRVTFFKIWVLRLLLARAMDVPEPRESDFGKDSTAYQKARYNFQMKAFEKAHKDGEWIAYQTGTSIIGVEADGFEPLRVNVRYQQPSTLIILKKKTGE
jgi:hypothetical protein